MLSNLSNRTRVALVSLGLMLPVGGVVLLDAGSSAASPRCASGHGRHHRTPHKDLDRDGCDRRGLDDGDGAKV